MQKLLAGFILLLSAMIQTNPDKDEFVFFVQDILIEESKNYMFMDIPYHLLAPLLVKEITVHTQKRNWVVFSLYKLEVNTYLKGVFRVKALGVANNFILLGKPELY
ncbi:MAG: hypothetical protein EPN89_09065 [Methylovulum sp.]|nr:MAG: hypothetical protein EPN89_09065 [Methylovulum sp.]